MAGDVILDFFPYLFLPEHLFRLSPPLADKFTFSVLLSWSAGARVIALIPAGHGGLVYCACLVAGV